MHKAHSAGPNRRLLDQLDIANQTSVKLLLKLIKYFPFGENLTLG